MLSTLIFVFWVALTAGQNEPQGSEQGIPIQGSNNPASSGQSPSQQPDQQRQGSPYAQQDSSDAQQGQSSANAQQPDQQGQGQGSANAQQPDQQRQGSSDAQQGGQEGQMPQGQEGQEGQAASAGASTQQEQGQQQEQQQGREPGQQQGQEGQEPNQQQSAEERMKIQERQRLESPQEKPLEEVLAMCKECTKAYAGFMSPDRVRKIDISQPVTLLVPMNEAIMQEASLVGMGEREQETMLKRHVLKGSVKKFRNGTAIGLIDIKNVTQEGEVFRIDGARVLGEYHPAAGGSGYWLIDKVLRENATQQLSGQQNPGGRLQPSQSTVWDLIARDPLITFINYSLSESPRISTEARILSFLTNVQKTQPTTFFFPSDQAFVQAMNRLQPPQENAKIVSYHEVPGLVTDLRDGMVLPTALEGQTLTVRIVNGRPTINGASLVSPLKLGTNNQGYYVIDRVLFPGDQQGQQAGSTQGPQPRVGQAAPLQPGVRQ